MPTLLSSHKGVFVLEGWSAHVPESGQFLVEIPSWVFAEVCGTEIGARLTVYRSRWLPEEDSRLTPVWDYLRQRCHELIDKAIVEDSYIMGHEAVKSEYDVYKVCPLGEHRCARLDKEGVL